MLYTTLPLSGGELHAHVARESSQRAHFLLIWTSTSIKAATTTLLVVFLRTHHNIPLTNEKLSALRTSSSLMLAALFLSNK